MTVYKMTEEKTPTSIAEKGRKAVSSFPLAVSIASLSLAVATSTGPESDTIFVFCNEAIMKSRLGKTVIVNAS